MSKFEEAARKRHSTGLLSEFWFFLRESRKWWLVPILIGVLLFGFLILLSGTAAAPFIYTLF